MRKGSVDYEALLALAKEQNLQPIVGEMLSRDPDFMKSPLYGKTVNQTIGAVASQAARTAAFLELYRAFDAAGVHPLVMKGLVCRRLYGELEDHRPSSDEDILIRPEDFGTVREVMRSMGYEPEREDTTEKQLEELHEVTFDNPGAGLHIEVHTNPIGQDSEIRRKMNDIFRSAFEEPRRTEVEGTQIWTLNHTEHFLLLVLHAFKHMIVNSFGIRQALDILLYDERFSGDIRWDYVYGRLKSVRAERFFCDVIAIGNQYLGFHLEARYGPNCPEDLLEDLMDNGIFGNMDRASITAASITSVALDVGKKPGRIRTILRSGFPSREFMAVRNPELADRPWLLPVCWLKRWIRFVGYNRKNGGGLAAQSLELSGQRVRLLKKYKLL